MAIMFNCAMDWTYDIFMEDSARFDAGEKFEDSFRESFIKWLKDDAKAFEQNWKAQHDGHLYDRYDGYVGTAYAARLSDSWFSDYYKDAYGQRPHLPKWFYIQAVKLPHEEDTARTFCASPVENAIDKAKRCREIV